MRVGHGYDVHRFAEGRRLILGGVELMHTQGLLGHSDADVLTHAVIDAMLGAAALGDIGSHFPDHDPAYRDVSSLLLLGRVAALLYERGYQLSNLDATIVAQAPKLAPYLPAMRQNLSKAIGVPIADINVKATTEEALGFTGRREGMAAHAVVLLKEIEANK